MRVCCQKPTLTTSTCTMPRRPLPATYNGPTRLAAHLCWPFCRLYREAAVVMLEAASKAWIRQYPHLITTSREPLAPNLLCLGTTSPSMHIPFTAGVFRLQGHLLAVTSLARHPSKPILVTCSDDLTWRMWHLPQGELIMTGEVSQGGGVRSLSRRKGYLQ